MDVAARRAVARDLPLLPAIEEAADGMFAPLGIRFPPGPTVVQQMIDNGAEIFVVGAPPLGYAAIEDVDGAVHLEQISVHPLHVRRGLGGLLLDAVKARADGTGAPGVSLLTFRDVPWNAPWYAKHGFVELPEKRWGPGLSAHWDAEIEAGLHLLGPRLVMWFPARRA